MHFNKLIPELYVSHFKKSRAFYLSLGFVEEYTRKDFAFLGREGSQLMIQRANTTWKTAPLTKPYGRGINLQIEVAHITPLFACVTQNKYTLVSPLQTSTYSVKGKKILQNEFVVADPDGYLLRFYEEISK